MAVSRTRSSCLSESSTNTGSAGLPAGSCTTVDAAGSAVAESSSPIPVFTRPTQEPIVLQHPDRAVHRLGGHLRESGSLPGHDRRRRRAATSTPRPPRTRGGPPTGRRRAARRARPITHARLLDPRSRRHYTDPRSAHSPGPHDAIQMGRRHHCLPPFRRRVGSVCLSSSTVSLGVIDWSIGAGGPIVITSCSDIADIPPASSIPVRASPRQHCGQLSACEAGRVTSRTAALAAYAGGSWLRRGAARCWQSTACRRAAPRSWTGPRCHRPGPSTRARRRPAVATTSASITPVTPDGLVTGPGRDRCRDHPGGAGRSVRGPRIHRGRPALAAVGQHDRRAVRPDDRRSPPAAWTVFRQDPSARPTGTSGPRRSALLAPVPPADVTLSASIAADQIPLVTATGTSAQLGPSGPLVAGATIDILAINGLQYLRTAGALAAGDTVGVLDDGSGSAAERADRGPLVGRRERRGAGRARRRHRTRARLAGGGRGAGGGRLDGRVDRWSARPRCPC